VSRELVAVKGHGTENDFVVIDDLQAVLSLSPSLVRALCDRHSGIGADGVLRVVRTELATEPDVRAQATQAPYFMDYHNADGSIAEMCGNGIRVFARYLQRGGIIDRAATIATRGGPRAVTLDGADITVDMGSVTRRPERPTVTTDGLLGARPGVAVELPNPHVVVEVATEQALADLDLSRAPRVIPGLPDGQNVEFFVRTGRHRLRMRVHERGVGETRSCGTGICAVVYAAAAGHATAREEWTVDLPGGQCRVCFTKSDSVLLTGPAVLVADLRIADEWLSVHR